ncbi:Uncharacterized protein PECH_005954 [Penicillium ucsense]|uniref:Cyanovirin-N domain-containing protein n=1 Tax=Penicillium ucsense TaxID=2839758 RepID=A0A8J8WJ93_9EURO|nr:Uncharacterized protein PECM_002156 [Penicillium ucsense]KAF7736022.1 Uncharacterized protein PECH_005954 [Penicillium ucsense]
MLQASCQNDHGLWEQQSFNLNDILGNEEGYLKLGSQAFSRSARHIRLLSSSPPILKAELRASNGTWREDSVNLDHFIAVHHGRLAFKHERSAPNFLLELGKQRGAFLDNVRAKIESYVEETGVDCLAVIEKKPESVDETHEPGDLEFAPAFFFFLIERRYHGHECESALIQPIIDIISNSFSELMSANSEKLQLYLGEQVIQSFANFSRSEIRKGCIKNTTDLVNKVIMKAMLLKAKFSVLKPLVKTHLQGGLKSLISKTIIKSLLKTAGIGKLSLLKGAFTTLFAGYIIYKLTKFPRDLGKSLSAGLNAMLEDNLEAMTQSLFKTVQSEVVDMCKGKVTEHIGEALKEEFKEEFKDAIKERWKQT